MPVRIYLSSVLYPLIYVCTLKNVSFFYWLWDIMVSTVVMMQVQCIGSSLHEIGLGYSTIAMHFLIFIFGKEGGLKTALSVVVSIIRTRTLLRGAPLRGVDKGVVGRIFLVMVNFLVLLKPMPCYIFQQKDLWS